MLKLADRLRRFHPVVSSRRGTALIAAFVYAAFVVYLTWPLAIHLDSRIFAVEPGDPMGSIAIIGEWVDGPHNPFLPGRLSDFSAPTGFPIDWSLNVAAFPSTALLWLLAFVFGPIAGWGLFTMLGFFASAMAMFLLLRSYTGDPWISLLFGWAFAFSPFAVLTAHSTHLIHGWLFVLLAWRMLRLAEEPTVRNGVLAGLAAVLTLAWTPYFILFGGVCYATFVAVDLVYALARRSAKPHLVAHAAGGAIVLLYLAALQAMWRTARPVSAPPNAGEDVITRFAASPMEYVVPPAQHPFFGDRTGPFITERVEPLMRVYPVYVGVVLLALALAALVVGLLRRNRVVLTFAAVSVVGFIFSLPPHQSVLGHELWFPSAFVSDLVPTWRIYSRFVVVVLLGVCVLAALGTSYLLRRARPTLRPALLGALFVAVPLDLWVTPPLRTTKVEIPAIYEVVRKQPPGTLAEYPLSPADLSGNYSFLFHQRAHRKPILNGYPPRTRAEYRAVHLSRLDDPSTPNRLAQLGVKYVLLRHTLEPGMIAPGKPTRQFRLIADSPYAALYKVVSAPGQGTTYPLSGFYVPEGEAPNVFRWMVEQNARIAVNAPCKRCVGTLEFRAASFARPRLLIVFDEHGRVLAAKGIPSDRPVTVRVPLRFSRQTVVRLRTNPAPERVSDVLGGTDTREVAVSVIQPVRFVRK